MRVVLVLGFRFRRVSGVRGDLLQDSAFGPIDPAESEGSASRRGGPWLV